jgi:hypothetical protein
VVEEKAMSNGKFINTPEEKAVLFDQFSKVMEVVREGNRPAEAVSRALQAAIRDDNIVIQPKVETSGDVKIYHVIANFANATEAIEACDCPLKWGFADGRMAKVPMVVQPVNQRMRIVVPRRVVYNRELPTFLPNLVSPIAALGFGFKFPKEQVERPIGTVWRDATGRFWCVYLRVDCGQRGVSVGQVDPDGYWVGNCGFLVGE